MIVNRKDLIASLEQASIGLTNKATIEQSDCFTFGGGYVTTFNDSIFVRIPTQLNIDGAVAASDLLAVLGKLPDEELDIGIEGGELRLKAGRREAGIGCNTTSLVPVIDGIQAPTRWTRFTDEVLTAVRQAALICTHDDTRYLTTVVHLTPKLIESCDNHRLFRVSTPTEFTEILVPGKSILALKSCKLVKFAIGEGWVHFKTDQQALISVRASHEKYHDGVDTLLVMGNPTKVTLPSNLAEIVSRADVMVERSEYETSAGVGVKIADGSIVVSSRKDTGWYRETKPIKEYAGPDLEFEISAEFLTQVLAKSRQVLVDKNKMKMVVGNMQFVVSIVPAPNQDHK